MPLNLLAAVASGARPSCCELVAAAQRAYEDVVAPALQVAPQCRMIVVRQAEDLSLERVPLAVEWAAVPVDEPLEYLIVQATSNDEEVAALHVGFPRQRRLVGGGIGEAEATVSFHVRRSAIRSGTVSAQVQAAVVRWTQDTFAAIGGGAGYVTLDAAVSSPAAESPYERAVLRLAAQRDFTRYAWTYAWGVALHKALVAALGGATAARSVRLARVEELDGGGLWLQASESLETMTDSDLHTLRDLLAHLLPAGGRALSDYRGPPALRL